MKPAQKNACKSCVNTLLTQNQKLNQTATELRVSDTVQEMKTSAGQVDAAIAIIKQLPMPSGIQLFSVQKENGAKPCQSLGRTGLDFCGAG